MNAGSKAYSNDMTELLDIFKLFDSNKYKVFYY